MTAVSIVALSTAAFAADLVVVDDTVSIATPAAYDWSGFYVGVHAGSGSGTIHLDPTFTEPDDEDVDGFFGGVQAGYNVQSGNLVFGIDSSLSLSGIHYDEDGDSADDTIDWLGSTTGRIGVALDGVLPYLKAGIAYAGATGDYEGVSVSNTHLGWTAGAGVEVAVSDSISLFAEYDYTNLGAEDYLFEPLIHLPIPVSMELHTVKAGLNFAF